MLLTAVNIGVSKASADVFSWKGDLDGIHYAVNDDINFTDWNIVSLCDMLFGQPFRDISHILVVVKNQIEGNK